MNEAQTFIVCAAVCVCSLIFSILIYNVTIESKCAVPLKIEEKGK